MYLMICGVYELEFWRREVMLFVVIPEKAVLGSDKWIDRYQTAEY